MDFNITLQLIFLSIFWLIFISSILLVIKIIKKIKKVGRKWKEYTKKIIISGNNKNSNNKSILKIKKVKNFIFNQKGKEKPIVRLYLVLIYR